MRGGIRIKILLGVLLVVIPLGGALTFEARRSMQAGLGRELEMRGASLAQSIAAQSVELILTGNSYGLHQLVAATQRGSEDVRYAFIVSPEGEILASTFGDALPRGLLEANAAPPGVPYRVRHLLTEEGPVHDVAVPVLGGELGTVRIGMTEAGARRAVARATGRLVGMTVASLAASALLALLLIQAFVRPLEEVVRATMAFARGDLDRRARVTSRDEFGMLAEAFNAMAAAIARLVGELRRKEEARSLLLQKVITAQEEERKRVARELHDETGQCLTSLIVGLKALEDLDDAEAMRRRAADLRACAAQALDGVHYLARHLRPSVLDDLGLAPALERYVAEFSAKFGLDVDLHVAGLAGVRLPREVETAVYRVIQEALTNVARHAGAQAASVVVERRGDALVAIVEDDGRGFDPEAAAAGDGALGLFGMRERAGLIGGSLTIESRPGHGTTVYLRVPLGGGEGEV